MAKQTINVGTTANDGTGDTLRAAGVKVNENFDELYAGNAGYVTVDTLPETIPEGRQVLYNGTMWRGLLEGESSLAAGTPWPVKGYKEWSGIIYMTTSDPFGSVAQVVKNSFFDGTEYFFSFVKGSTGRYELRTSEILPESTYGGNVLTYYGQIGQASNFIFPVRVGFFRSGPPYSGVIIEMIDSDGNSADVSSTAQLNIDLKLYPPSPE